MSDESYVRLCAECDSNAEIVVQKCGDEGWDFCPECRTVEGRTREVSEDEWEKMS